MSIHKNVKGLSNINHLDVGYSALWDKSDYDTINKRFKQISELSKEVRLNNINALLSYNSERLIYEELMENSKILKIKKALLVNKFEDELERSYNDQTTSLEPLEVNKQYDRVVSGGMNRIAEFVVGESTQFFDHFAAGTSSTPAYQSDNELIAEIARVSIEIQGYATASGAVIKYGAYFAPNVPSASITEAGVFDDPAAGVMLFRTVYVNKSIIHVQGSTFFSLSHAIYQSST